ncbi:MAG: hypothetical protein V4568_13285 [Pseudomonadota bacterium]
MELQYSNAKWEHEGIALRRQVAWFKRQMVWQQSERYIIEFTGAHSAPGEPFDTLLEVMLPAKITDRPVCAANQNEKRTSGQSFTQNVLSGN